MPALYDELAPWWPLFSPVADYAGEAATFVRVFREARAAPIRSVLELGSGGGNVASFLKREFAMTLAEPSAGMRRVSLDLNADCEHLAGDMRSFRAGRTFDAVFVHDAVCYMTSEADLAAAFATAAAHLVPGGVALFAPDFTRETFAEATEHDGSDGEGRAIRWLMWTHDPDPADSLYSVDFAIVLREAGRATRVVHDRHVEGLFSRATWLRLLAEAGFEARIVRDEAEGRDLFVGVRI